MRICAEVCVVLVSVTNRVGVLPALALHDNKVKCHRHSTKLIGQAPLVVRMAATSFSHSRPAASSERVLRARANGQGQSESCSRLTKRPRCKRAAPVTKLGCKQAWHELRPIEPRTTESRSFCRLAIDRRRVLA